MSDSNSGSGATSGGIGIGAVLAVILSWTANKSIWWAALHGICGWGYVIYYAIFL